MLGTKILEERKSKYNGNLRAIRTFGLGTYIQADGLTQSGSVVDDIWRKTLKKVKSRDIKTCLILGYGGGSAAIIVNKLWPEAKITGVDIDKDIVELGEKYLGKAKAAVVITDADRYLRMPNNYDLVIVDTYLGDKYVELLPKNGNLIIFNRLFYKDKKKEALAFGEKLKKIFRKVDYFYPGVNLVFICYN